MAHFAVTAIGRDRPGIVAALTAALHDLGGNLEDVSSTILRGHFAMMLVVDAPDGIDGRRIHEAVDAGVRPLGVRVTVSDVEEGATDRPTATHVVTAYGSDRPGIVARIAGTLASAGANVTDLSCRLTTAERPLYAMVAEVAISADADADRVASDVAATGRELGVDVAVEPIDVETL